MKHELVRNGDYGRWIPVGAGSEWGRIFRKYCSVCDVSFSLLPDFVLRGHQYGRHLVVSWLWERIHGASFRSREFLSKHGIPHPLPEPGTSWSDLLDHVRTGPGYQLLWYWARAFSLRAQKALPSLISTCIQMGCDLKDVIGRVAAFATAPRSIWPLVIALGLFAGIQEAGRSDSHRPALKDALFDLVGYLTTRRLPPSHEIRRASGGRAVYDSVSAPGWSPPPGG